MSFTYKNQEQIDWENNPLYHVMKYRSEETQRQEESLDDFLFWLDHDCDEEISKDARNDLQDLINQFIGYDIEKVKQGELILLEKWTQAVKGDTNAP